MSPARFTVGKLRKNIKRTQVLKYHSSDIYPHLPFEIAKLYTKEHMKISQKYLRNSMFFVQIVDFRLKSFGL